MESKNLLDKEFKTLVIRMLNELSENFNRQDTIKTKLENIKKIRNEEYID